MSAELLREAAALMRARAELASPSPWKADGEDISLGPDPYNLAAITCSRNVEADAEHIASWHPAVALAVADWLDDAVAVWAALLPYRERERLTALAVARAYLSRDS